MSDLQKSFTRATLAKLPPRPLPLLDLREQDEDGSDLPLESPTDSSSSASSTGTIIPSPSRNLFERAKGSNNPRIRAAPLPWEDFFAQEYYLDRQVDDLHISHHAYFTPPTASGPLFVTHHGAGSSGLSFATLTSEILKLLPKAGLLSLDARGHGATTIEAGTLEAPKPGLDLTLDTLAADLAFIVRETQKKMGWQSLPGIVLIGHSLGGAVVTDVAHKRLLGESLLGYGVLDVVEGSALEALQSMETYLMTRPLGFPSLTSGIEWHTRSRTIRNITSARVSIPPLLQQSSSSEPRPTSAAWTWRTDLAATKPFWENWFVGLSKKFLEAPGGKLLLLAGTDRLDRELMIGQMQGKYQLQVLPEAGHFIHEDQPAKTAQVVVDFHRRNDRSALVLPPKVGDLLKQGKLQGEKGALAK